MDSKERIEKAKIDVQEIGNLYHEIKDDYTVIIGRYQQLIKRIEDILDTMELINGQNNKGGG